jgi:hypothetical protein
MSRRALIKPKHWREIWKEFDARHDMAGYEPRKSTMRKWLMEIVNQQIKLSTAEQHEEYMNRLIEVTPGKFVKRNGPKVQAP